MGFVKASEEIVSRLQKPVEFYDVKRLIVAWETRADIVRELLPPPLKPAPMPIAFAYLANMPRTTFGRGYREHFPAPDRMGFDYPPRLIRHETEFEPTSIEIGEGEIVLRPSEFDPWAELEVVRMLGAVYSTGNVAMRKGAVIGELDGMAFLPYAFLRWDF